MDYLDNEAEVSSSSILVPSSQQDLSSAPTARPAKRRRLNPFQDDQTSSEEDNYDLPSNNAEDDDAFDNAKSKYDNYLHVPAHVQSQRDEFCTQANEPWSSPSAIRGPRWRKKGATSARSPSPTRQKNTINTLLPQSASIRNLTAKVISTGIPIVADEFDDDEEAQILEALAADEDFENVVQPANSSFGPSQPSSSRQQKSMRQTTLFGMNTTQRPPHQASQRNKPPAWRMADKNEPPTHHSIDKEAMKSWIYPLNVGSIRDYQFNIVHRALFNNILVALPTGLGKTFIAATVMLNFFRWTKEAQIVFVAPTKPLVTQQVDACFHIAGIPRSNTTLLTGEISPAVRADEWQSKRVFFMTPQTLINDLKTGMADPKKIVLVVVDEAHKATGNYAYVEVIRFLRRFNTSFRVLALTATPGATVEAVQKVIDGLDIARVEIRTEESLDIRTFVHSRNTELQIFDNSEEIEMCLDLFATAVKPVLTRVANLNAYFSSDPKNMTLYGLMMGRDKWAKSDAGRKADWGLKGMVNACFKPLMSLAHNLELLKYHGIGPFYHKMKIFDEESSGNGKYARQITEHECFKKLMDRLRNWVNSDDFVGHPKLSYLNEVVLNHFMDAGNALGAANGRPPSDTRIMIFAHYRDSAEEITRVLNRHQPMIRAHVFVGQSGTKGSEGMDQKTQIEIIQKFKAGTYNTLVATSIGEEGLDIGEVDLIVCYDCSKSPIRMLQRMGRTGRKRAGNIVLLLMRGKEERDYHAAKDNYIKMQEIIEKGTDFQFHDEQSPRIVPREIEPTVDKRIVQIPVENTQPGIPEPRKSKVKNTKRPPKRFHMPDGVETGFSFLGPKKGKNTRPKSPTPEPSVDVEDAILPPLKDILLTTQEEDELNRRYAQVAGDEPVYIQHVRFDVHPDHFRTLSKTKLIKHSSMTRSLVKASRTMHSPFQRWDRPPNDSPTLHFPPSSDSDENKSSRAPHPKLKHRTSSQKPNRKQHQKRNQNSSTTRSPADIDIDAYDTHDSFIDDNPSNAIDNLTSSALDSSQPILRRLINRRAKQTPYHTQSSNMPDQSSDPDEALPEMSAILNRANKNSTSVKVKRNTTRKVIQDSSDE